jgi:hypothetical protein
MSGPLGPFAVEPDQIVRLGASFTLFVNRLLDVEHAASNQAGANLTTNYWENIPDGGVDAEVRGATASRWLPEGDSAFQFKRGDLTPGNCRKELAGATWARELIANGSKYRLVLGVALTSRQITNRRNALRSEAANLGLPVSDDTFEVLDANALARWASDHPSLAVSRLLRGPGQLARDFEAWSSSNRHKNPWVASADREAMMASLQTAIADRNTSDIRLDGVAGIGKTRLAMEALRGGPVENLVAYVGDAEALNQELVNHLLAYGRSAVVVVDGCTGRKHEKLAEAIPTESPVKLLTIGEPDTYTIRAPLLRLSGLSEETLDSILKENWPKLWPEARRFVTTQSDGNVGLALLLGEKIVREPRASANALMQSSDISGLLSPSLTEGGDFLAAAVLALSRRIGWDGELSRQVERLASATGISLERIRNVGATLERQGLLVRQGRYRSVSPHPVAMFLAAHAWRELGDHLVKDLVPLLDEDFAHSFFSRAADLGEFEPARTAIRRLLAVDGPFGTLDSIENSGSGKILTQIAIVAPDETSRHLTDLIQSSSRDHLLGLRGSRRDLVWTLEKLVWHSRTFDEAADNLLSLATAENEEWANNATGTWVDLFGTFLPGTAAKPDQRLEYLRRVARSADAEVRKLVIKAVDRGLEPHETITVSGELQGGVLVEPRGTPATYGEAFEYQGGLVEILAEMLNDSDAEIVDSAESALIEAIHPTLQIQPIRDRLIGALLQMRPEGLRKARAKVEHLSALFERANASDPQVEGLRAVASRLPAAGPLEELSILVSLRRWDFGEGELQARIEAAVRALPESDRQHALELLDTDVPAAWELGRAIAVVWGQTDGTTRALVSRATTSLPALVGYLWGLQDQGNPAAFDDFLESEAATPLSPALRVAVAVRGPATDRGIARVLSQLRGLSPAEGAVAMFGWHRSLSAQPALSLIGDWSARIESQRDYNAVVDFTGMVLLDADELWEPLKEVVRSLVMMRRVYPDLGGEEWDWAQLAGRLLPDDGVALAHLFFDVIESTEVMVYQTSEDAQILLRSVAANPAPVWNELAGRLEAGSWRLELSLRGWLINSVPADIVTSWIGSSVDRARVVASVAAVGDEEPTEIARVLLDRFGGDDRVSSSLSGDFISGFWTGNESERLARQIGQLQGWVSRSSEPLGVRNWARRMIQYLEESRSGALQREAEERD